MGFEIPEPRVDFEFADGPLQGVTVNAGVSLSPAVYFGLKQWLETKNDLDIDARMAADRIVAELFIEHARPTWNLTRNGIPVPPNVDEMVRFDDRVLRLLVEEWIGQFGRVPLPLPAASPTGSRAARRASKRRGSTAGS